MPITTLSRDIRLGGVPRRGIYDNMRTAVDKEIGRGKEAPRSTPASRRWSAISYSRPKFCNPSLRVGEGADREERPGRPPSALAADARLPLPGGAERLAGDALPGTVGPDAARLPTRRDRRRMGRRSRAEPDAAFAPVRRLRRTRASACRRRAWSIWTAIATACRRRSPIVRSACGCIPSASSSSPRGRSCAEHRRVFARLPRTEEHNNGLRLAALSGGRSTQARSLAQWRAFRRTAACLPGSAAAHAQDAGRRRRRDGRGCLALVLQHERAGRAHCRRTGSGGRRARTSRRTS